MYYVLLINHDGKSKSDDKIVLYQNGPYRERESAIALVVHSGLTTQSYWVLVKVDGDKVESELLNV